MLVAPLALALAVQVAAKSPELPPAVAELAAACATELDWATDWEEAAERARAEARPILCHALIYPGFAIADPDVAGVLMDPFVLELVRERYVPYRLRRAGDVPFAAPELYGLGPASFGRGFLVVTAEGEVVAEATNDLYHLLLRGLRLVDTEDGFDPASLADPLERAARHLRRGELPEARALASADASARAGLLLAEVALRERDGPAVERGLARARSAPDAEAYAADVGFLRALLALRRGEPDARRRLETWSAGHPEHPRAPEAAYWLGATALVDGAGREAALEAWAVLFERHAKSPWARKAAGIATGTGFALGVFERVRWPDREVLHASRSAPFVELPAAAGGDGSARLAGALASARAWLLEHQRPDGSWASPTEEVQARDEIPNEFTLAATALGAQALLGDLDSPRSRDAVELALEHALARYAAARRVPAFVSYLDYRVWSRACLLALLADATRHGLREPEELEDTAAQVVGDLSALQHPDGGWSYYVTNDLSAAPGATPAQPSISFTTACVVLALQDALDAGYEVPPEVLERGLDALEHQRNADGSFEYFGSPRALRRPTPAGSAGRGPVCTLALLRAGRVDPPALVAALDAFREHAPELGRERGKVMMHCGREAQGSHYLFFDYATCARAIATLPAGERGRHRTPLLEELLLARSADGAFLDNPLIGWAVGTALAARALDHLARP